MEEIEIFQHALTNGIVRFGKVAILRSASRTLEPKRLLEHAVHKYVETEGYNEFIEINLDNPWIRLIVSGINNCNYHLIKMDVECYDQDLPVYRGGQICRVAIIRGGLRSEKPFSFMNEAVGEYAGSLVYNQFIEIHMDNPWVRVVLIGLNELIFVPFTNQRLNEEN